MALVPGNLRGAGARPWEVRPHSQWSQVQSPFLLGLMVFAYWNEHPEDAEAQVMLALTEQGPGQWDPKAQLLFPTHGPKGRGLRKWQPLLREPQGPGCAHSGKQLHLDGH